MTIDAAALPKAELHSHLDGGLRIATIMELAAETGYDELPETDEDSLAEWFYQDDSGSLERYLEAFRHTVGVMQTVDALERVAYEAVVDLAAENVVYGEIRFGPGLHTERGLTLHEVIAAVRRGVARGEDETGVVAPIIVAALRHRDDSEQVARVAADFIDDGVVAFDLAGPEAGFPPENHLAACRIAREAGLGLTIHGGEADGPNSMWRAIARCGARRIGHGVRIIEDTRVVNGAIVEMGAVARMVRDHRIPLEVCVSSNLGIGAFADAASHPLGLLRRAGFAVTISTDNRLMSATTMNHEFELAMEHHGFGLAELGEATALALLEGFGDWEQRRRLLDDVVRPAYSSS
jgi:adenosine deaminase